MRDPFTAKKAQEQIAGQFWIYLIPASSGARKKTVSFVDKYHVKGSGNTPIVCPFGTDSLETTTSQSMCSNGLVNLQITTLHQMRISIVKSNPPTS